VRVADHAERDPFLSQGKLEVVSTPNQDNPLMGKAIAGVEGKPILGVDVDFKDNVVAIDLYVIIEYGVRIKAVASSISENVKYRIEKDTGLTIDHIDVHIRGLRISNSD